MRGLSDAVNGNALFCRDLTTGVYLDGIFGALLT